jgi:muconate cycloisomerase
MADEAIYPPKDAIDVVRHDAASIALMKITKHGGLLHVQKTAAIFEAAGLSLSVAIYFDVIAAVAAHVAAALPCVSWPSPFTDLRDTILREPYEPDGLLLKVPDGPGFGVDLDPDKLERYATSSAEVKGGTFVK